MSSCQEEMTLNSFMDLEYMDLTMLSPQLVTVMIWLTLMEKDGMETQFMEEKVTTLSL